MSKYLTQQLQQKPRAGGFLATRLRDKGWNIRDAAEYLGVSRQRLYDVFGDPGRARLWECAIAGMPECTAEIVQALKEARSKRPKPVPREKITAVGFEVGDVVMATKHAGICEEDVQGWIAGLRGSGSSLEILVRVPDDEDWFPEKLFHEFFATTGLKKPI